MNQPVVTMLGDSITAGYGLRAVEALPVGLQAAMSSLGVNVNIVNAGVSGNTVRDGLRRLHRSVPASTTLCIVALGANDLMQSVAPERIRSDLDEVVTRLLARPTKVLLCGMRAPPSVGAYARAFDAVFPSVARDHLIPLYPFLLHGVALNPLLSLPDRIHPNAQGIEIVAQRLAPRVVSALR